MRVVIQRVSEAEVKIKNEVVGAIGRGLLLLVGFEEDNTQEDIEYIGAKIANLRIFSDEEGKMNLSVNDIKGEALVVSQFTLFAQTKKGNRPSFIRAAKPEKAIAHYESFIQLLQQHIPTKIQTGKFGADMKIFLINDGPVTILLDSKNKE